MNKKGIIILMVLLIAACLYGEDVIVPDLVTGITNTGSTIPDSAVPVIKPPVHEALPSLAPVAKPVVSAIPAPVIIIPPIEIPPVQESVATTALASPVVGYVDFGAGSPGIVYGDFSVMRKAGAIPGFSTDFQYDSSDGYGYDKPGEGFFDRKTVLDVHLYDDTRDIGWRAALNLSDRTDGIRGEDDFDPNVNHREVSWDSGLNSDFFEDSGFAGSVSFGGSVFSSTAGEEGVYNGYFLSPRAAITYSAGTFFAEAYSRYGYETVSEIGELNFGTVGLDLSYNRWGLTGKGEVQAFLDSVDGVIVPFGLGLAYDNTSIFLRRIAVDGGMDVWKSSTYILSVNEPFAALHGTAAYASDWYVKGSLTIVPLAPLALTGEAEFRRTAFGRAPFVLESEADPDTYLIPSTRIERDSFITKAFAQWTGPFFAITGGYTVEWLDRLYRDSLQALDAGLRVFDQSADRIWEASVFSTFAFDKAQLPELSAKGTVRPVKDLALSLAFNDAFDEREVILSARIDF